MSMRKRKGFTLVEILIVVVILGILAAIVIPQFSDASTQSKVSSAKSSLQTLRSQISLYKIQHNDNAPDADLFVDAMTKCSDAEASESADYVDRTTTNKSSHPYGPYLQAMPKNPFNNSITLGTESATNNGWIYDENTGEISIDAFDVTDATLQTELKAF